MELEPKRFNEFNHLKKLDAAHAMCIGKQSWNAHKEIWAKNKQTVVILSGDKHWKMNCTEWAKLFKIMEAAKCINITK